MEAKKPKIERIKIKNAKKLKKEAVNLAISEMAESVVGPEIDSAMIPEGEDVIEDGVFSQEDPQEKLTIDENFVEEEKSEAEDSDTEDQETVFSIDEIENEIRSLNRHLFGINENIVSYPKDTHWSKYTDNGGLTLKLNLKILVKTYLLNQGLLEECSKITLTSNLDFNDPRIINILEGLNNPTELTGKIHCLEKNLTLLNGQMLKNSTQIATMGKDRSTKTLLNTMQVIQASLAKDITALKDNNPKTANMVSIKNLQDIVEELNGSLELKCKERSKSFISKYPFGFDLTLEKLVNKDSDLSKQELQIIFKAVISYSDAIVATVLLDIIGINLKNPNTGKLMSEFAKNLAFPLLKVDAEARIRQRGQFARLVGSWDLILKYLINPGMLNATSIIEETRISMYSLTDMCAEGLPIGTKMKSLGMLFMAGQQNYPKNGHVLEKIFELRPQIPSRKTASFEPWPKNKFNWSNIMKNWAKDIIPMGKPAYFVDINTPHDLMSTNTSQKEFAYNLENGNIPKDSTQRLNSNRILNKTKNNQTGNSGLSVWDICQRNSNKQY